MDRSFGARLRSQRESRGVALSVIAEQTKIKVAMLEGLERDDLSHWPTGIFRRSYVRAYAQAIGLEPEATVREFLERYPEPLEEQLSAALAAARGLSTGRWPPTRIGLLIGAALDAVPSLRPPFGQREVAHVHDTPAGDGDSFAPPKPVPATGNDTAGIDSAAVESSAAARTDVLKHDLSAQPRMAMGREDQGPIADRGHSRGDAGSPADTPTRSSAAEGVSPGHRRLLQAELDLSAVAGLCTRLGRVAEVRELHRVLKDAARMLDAVGLILWIWDARVNALTAAFAHGYSAEMLGRLPPIRPEADNAVAAAFRSSELGVVDGGLEATGAVVAPLITSGGCAGVLALELRDGRERHSSVRGLATILAAQLSTLVGFTSLARAANG